MSSGSSCSSCEAIGGEAMVSVFVAVAGRVIQDDCKDWLDCDLSWFLS